MGILETMIDIPAEHEKNVFGQFDIFAKKIERALHVTLIARNGKVKVLGEEKNVERAQQVLSQLTELSRRGNTIQEQTVRRNDQSNRIHLKCHIIIALSFKPHNIKHRDPVYCPDDLCDNAGCRKDASLHQKTAAL